MDRIMNYDTLKKRHRQEQDGYHSNLSLRVHRSLSWLQRAEQLDDPDSRFIFLWIAFNAAYATEISEEYRTTETIVFRGFLEKLSGLDAGRQQGELVWNEFPRSIRVLLNNRFVFQPFWDYHNANSARQNGRISSHTQRLRLRRPRVLNIPPPCSALP